MTTTTTTMIDLEENLASAVQRQEESLQSVRGVD